MVQRKKNEKGKKKWLLSYKTVHVQSHCTVQAAIIK